MSPPGKPGHSWDIVGITRPAFFYFSLTFLTGFIFGVLRVKYIIPVLHFDPSKAEICEMPFMLVAMEVWARFIVVWCKVPEAPGIRLAMGFIALGLMALTELLGKWAVYKSGVGEMVRSEYDDTARGAFAVALVVFGLMPWLLMVTGSGLEKGLRERAHVSEGSKNNV